MGVPYWATFNEYQGADFAMTKKPNFYKYGC